MDEFRKKLLELCNECFDAGGKMAVAQDAQKKVNDMAEQFVADFSGCEPVDPEDLPEGLENMELGNEE